MRAEMTAIGVHENVEGVGGGRGGITVTFISSSTTTIASSSSLGGMTVC